MSATAFGPKALLSAAALYLLATACVLDWPGILGVGRCGGESQVDAGGAAPGVPSFEWDRERLTAQYNTVVDEIKLRLEHENDLYLLRFSLCGAVLALIAVEQNWLGKLRGQSSRKAATTASSAVFLSAVLWTASIVSTLIDGRATLNGKILGTLGSWVASSYERGARDGWETFLARARDRPEWPVAVYSLYAPSLVLLLVTLVVAVILSRRNHRLINGANIVGAGLFAFVVLTRGIEVWATVICSEEWRYAILVPVLGIPVAGCVFLWTQRAQP